MRILSLYVKKNLDFSNGKCDIFYPCFNNPLIIQYFIQDGLVEDISLYNVFELPYFEESYFYVFNVNNLNSEDVKIFNYIVLTSNTKIKIRENIYIILSNINLNNIKNINNFPQIEINGAGDGLS